MRVDRRSAEVTRGGARGRHGLENEWRAGTSRGDEASLRDQRGNPCPARTRKQMARMYRLSPSEQRHWKRGSPATTLAGFVLAAMLGVPFPADVDAQETDPAPVRVTIQGVVLDELTGTPVPGAAVYVEDESYGALADSLGAFRIEGVAADSQTVVATQFGYWEIAAVVDVPEAGASSRSNSSPGRSCSKALPRWSKTSTRWRAAFAHGGGPFRTRPVRSTRNGCCAARRPMSSISCGGKPTLTGIPVRP